MLRFFQAGDAEGEIVCCGDNGSKPGILGSRPLKLLSLSEYLFNLIISLGEFRRLLRRCCFVGSRLRSLEILGTSLLSSLLEEGRLRVEEDLLSVTLLKTLRLEIGDDSLFIVVTTGEIC